MPSNLKLLNLSKYLRNVGSIVISGHPAKSLSGEEIKELSAKRKAQKLAQKVMAGDEWVLVSDETFAGF
jgi:hypothetical protein